MTATPSVEVGSEKRLGLTDQEKDDQVSVLGRRRFTPKPTELRIATAAKVSERERRLLPS